MLPSSVDDRYRPSWHRGVAKTAEGGVAKTDDPGVAYVTGVGSPKMTGGGRLLCRSTPQSPAKNLAESRAVDFLNDFRRAFGELLVSRSPSGLFGSKVDNQWLHHKTPHNTSLKQSPVPWFGCEKFEAQSANLADYRRAILRQPFRLRSVLASPSSSSPKMFDWSLSRVPINREISLDGTQPVYGCHFP